MTKRQPSVRIRARRGHQFVAVAVARKLTVLCWHLLTKDEDYLWARPALVANKARDRTAGWTPTTEGQPTWTGLRLYVKALRNQEMLVAAQAERSHERFIAQSEPRRPKDVARGRLKPAGRK